jgi:hypothetical protein
MDDNLPIPDLNTIIPPEIKDDDLYQALFFLTRNARIKTVLEIGASSGAGSTEALARGIAHNREKPLLFTIEASPVRFRELAARYMNRKDVKPYNISSVGLNDFADESTVRNFCRSHSTVSNVYSEQLAIDWLKRDIAYIAANPILVNGIAAIKAEHHIENFGLVLIDGNEFTGRRELDLVYGATIIVLDDIMTFKNFDNHHRLLNDPAYEICMMNLFLRNGYSIFIRRPISCDTINVSSQNIGGSYPLPQIAARIEELEKLNWVILNSRSWRLTSPLRRAKRLLSSMLSKKKISGGTGTS